MAGTGQKSNLIYNPLFVHPTGRCFAFDFVADVWEEVEVEQP